MKRKGGVPPIVTVLVTIAAIVAAALVAYFIYTSTAAATKQPVIDVSPLYVTGGTPATTSSGPGVSCGGSNPACRLSITIRNVGSVTLSNVAVWVWLPGATSALQFSPATGGTTLATLGPGQSATFGYTETGTRTIPDGQGVTVEVRYTSGGTTYVITLATKTAVP
ncbi:MAG: hypothetical protein QXJ99_05145 [Thermofilum sp.]